MEDGLGLGKLADSKLVNKLYDDLAANAMKEGGGFVVDVVKTVRLVGFLFQLGALFQDKVKARLEEVRRRVPEGRRVGARPSIAVPILLPLTYMEDNNPLTELYLNLLARATDKERQNEAHPAFVKIIEQISPDEAVAMLVLRDSRIHFEFDVESDVEPGYTEWATVTVKKELKETNFPMDQISDPDSILMCLGHLQALNLVTMRGGPDTAYGIGVDVCQFADYYPTQFGQLFIKACIPEAFTPTDTRQSPSDPL